MNPLDTLKRKQDIYEPFIELTKREKKVLKAFEGATERDWEDWRWQIRNRIRTRDVLAKIIDLTEEEIQGIDGSGEKLTMAIPPYFAALIDPKDPKCVI